MLLVYILLPGCGIYLILCICLWGPKNPRQKFVGRLMNSTIPGKISDIYFLISRATFLSTWQGIESHGYCALPSHSEDNPERQVGLAGHHWKRTKLFLLVFKVGYQRKYGFGTDEDGVSSSWADFWEDHEKSSRDVGKGELKLIKENLFIIILRTWKKHLFWL